MQDRNTEFLRKTNSPKYMQISQQKRKDMSTWNEVF